MTNNKKEKTNDYCEKCLGGGIILTSTHIMICDMCGGGKKYQEANYLNLS